METVTIDGHTFVPRFIKDGGWIIDAGARGFRFSDELRYGYRAKVYAIDIENFPSASFCDGYEFRHAALAVHSGKTEAYFFGNGTGNFLKGINEPPGNTADRPCEIKTVPCITLQNIYNEIGTDIDLLKLDIEGSEYQVMEKMEPIPKQISVEFHQHCHPHLHSTYIEGILERLCKHYHLHLFNCEPKYQFLDCLFIRKDIL